MSQKVRKTLIMIVMAALIICLMAASLTYTFTYGRYAGGKFNSTESPYDDLIEFVGAREYTVRSPEELIQAIEDGYSNIKIADDAEEPFVITEGVTDVTANLVLNLNGKVVVRNSRNPMLDVQTNVSVVLVYDSTNKGAFYNPVGSSLMASGGSLTVGSGGYESGPREEDYEDEAGGGTLSDSTAEDSLFVRSGGEENGNASWSVNLDRSLYTADFASVKGVSLPTIKPTETTSNNRTTVHGNVYLESAKSEAPTWLPADTFLVYTIEEDCFIGDGTSSGGVKFELGKLYVDAESETVGDVTTVTASEFTTPLCNVASCDFYYYYPIEDDDNDGYHDYAVIYGYWDVMKLARDKDKAATALKDNGLIYPYGAVRMVEGEGIVRGGTFSNHFDAVNTYGIYAEGGTLSVSKNTTVDTTFTTGGEGVCIRVQSAKKDAEADAGEDVAATGGSLTISGGEFSSEKGNTIEMSGGNMTVTKGTFTKDATGADPDSTDNGSAIDIQGGKLSMTGSDAKTFTITGSHVNGIKSSGGGTVTAEHTTFSMNGGGTDVVPENGKTYGTDMFGINIDSGSVTANGCEITIYGTYSAGILSAGNANVSLGATNRRSEIAVWIPTDNEAEKKLSSSGVSSEGGSITLTGDVLIDTNGLGITARGLISISKGETKVNTDYGTGVLVSGEAGGDAKIVVAEDAVLSVDSKIDSDWGWVLAPGHEDEGETIEAINKNNGIYVENGSIDASAGTLNVTHTGVAGDEPDNNSTTGAATKSYAVFVKGDAEGGSQTTSVSIGSGTITGTNAGGVYVVGTSKQDGAQTTYTATVTLGGVNVTAQNTYAAGILTETGNVIINGNAQITSSALGIAVINGNMGISADSTDSSVKATRATGVYVRGGSLTNDGTLNVTSTITNSTGGTASTAEDAYKWAGADISGDTNSNIYNGVFVNGGSLESTGTLNVTFTGVQNAAFNTETQEGKVNTSYLNQQIKSYAVRVDNGNAIIVLGEIKNGVGGGVLVNGGTVELGAVDAENDDLIVSTTGSNYDDQTHYVTGNQWQYDWTLTGGHAVAVEGGTLNIYSGTYTAQMGNGILVRNLASDSTQNTVTVKDGIFEGYNGSGRRVGPGAFYALKVLGGPLTLNINGGTFGKALVNDEVPSTNGGAFVMGNPDTKQRAKVNITNGAFNSYNSDTFAVFRYVDASFGSSEGTGNVSMTVTKAENEGSNFAAIGVQNDLVYNNDAHSDRGSTITIASGSYTGGFGIWYGSSTDKVNISGGEITGTSDGILYSASGAVESSLSISGGMITGNIGLNLAEAPAASSAVTISGGTIKGYQDGILYSKSVAIDGDGYGLTIKGGTITGTGTIDVHAHALNINTEPQRHSILIEDGATLNGGRDAIFVSQSGGGGEAVSITGGTIQGGTVSSGGCALWFAAYIDSPVFQISGGTFSSIGGGAISSGTNRWGNYMNTGNIFATGAYCFTDTPAENSAGNLAIYNRIWEWTRYSYYQVGGSGSSATINLDTTVYGRNGAPLGRFNEISTIVVSSYYDQQTWD